MSNDGLPKSTTPSIMPGPDSSASPLQYQVLLTVPLLPKSGSEAPADIASGSDQHRQSQPGTFFQGMPASSAAVGPPGSTSDRQAASERAPDQPSAPHHEPVKDQLHSSRHFDAASPAPQSSAVNPTGQSLSERAAKGAVQWGGLNDFPLVRRPSGQSEANQSANQSGSPQSQSTEPNQPVGTKSPTVIRLDALAISGEHLSTSGQQDVQRQDAPRDARWSTAESQPHSHENQNQYTSTTDSIVRSTVNQTDKLSNTEQPRSATESNQGKDSPGFSQEGIDESTSAAEEKPALSKRGEGSQPHWTQILHRNVARKRLLTTVLVTTASLAIAVVIYRSFFVGGTDLPDQQVADGNDWVGVESTWNTPTDSVPSSQENHQAEPSLVQVTPNETTNNLAGEPTTVQEGGPGGLYAPTVDEADRHHLAGDRVWADRGSLGYQEEPQAPTTNSLLSRYHQSMQVRPETCSYPVTQSTHFRYRAESTNVARRPERENNLPENDGAPSGQAHLEGHIDYLPLR